MEGEEELQSLDKGGGDSLLLTNDAFEKESSTSSQDGQTERDHWTGRFEFLLAIVGYTVGIGSIWRFPMICAKNGGGAFLIPFAFFLIVCGGPLYYMEVCLGQFSGKSAAVAFELCPLFKGLGTLMLTLSCSIQWYYVTTMMWSLYFLYNSFMPVLPWTTCGNWWNTEHCRDYFASSQSNNSYIMNFTSENVTSENNISMSTSQASSIDTTPAFEFWKNNVLRKSSGLEEMGQVELHLLICHFLAYVMIVLTVIKGVRSLGKVVYVTATAPYIFLTILLIRGLTLDGAVDGLKFYLTLDFQKLADYQVWLQAAVQVFFSLGPTWGGVITMSSFNKFHKKSFWDTVIVVGSDFFTAFYAGLAVFTITGFMAKESGRTVAEVAKTSGPGLAFVAYPTAIGRLPLPQLWAVMFFLMMLTIQMDSFFANYETIVNGVIDSFPKQLMNKHLLVNLATGTTMFLLGLPFACSGGIYLFQLADWYSSAFALLLGSALECIVIGWIYGAERFAKDITLMTGREVSVFLRVLWVIVTPILLAIAFITLFSEYSQPEYGDGYTYQPYAIVIGICIGLLPIAAMVVVGLWQVIKAKGSLLERLKYLLEPAVDWGPSDRVEREIYHLQPYEYPSSLWKRMYLNIRGEKTTPIL